MDTYNENTNKEFYRVVKIIVNDKDIRKIIRKMSPDDIYDVICYLDNKLYLQLYCFLENITNKLSNYNLQSNNLLNNFICYFELCNNKYIKFSNILIVCKSLLMKAGAKKKQLNQSDDSNKNIVMQGITVTMKSILNRQFDKNKIDNNLRQGAIERQEYLQYSYNKKGKIYKDDEIEPIFDENTPIKPATTKKYVTSEISAKPETQGKNLVHTHSNIINLPSETTVKNYKQGVETLKNINPKNMLDIPLSPPLDEPPAGNTGTTLITGVASIPENTENIDTTENTENTKNTEKNISTKEITNKNTNILLTTNQSNNNQKSSDPNIDSKLVRIIKVPFEKLYKDAPFNR